jgi:hypothetical protein
MVALKERKVSSHEDGGDARSSREALVDTLAGENMSR